MHFLGGVDAGNYVDESVEVEYGEVGGAGDKGDYDEEGVGGEFVVYAPEGLWRKKRVRLANMF